MENPLLRCIFAMYLLVMLTTAVSAQSSSLQLQAFGMHEHNIAANGWPKVPVGSFRIVGDQVPNVSWADLEPSRGHYDWAKLDALVDHIKPHDVDIVYAFRQIPPWASSRPRGPCGHGREGTGYAPA